MITTEPVVSRWHMMIKQTAAILLIGLVVMGCTPKEEPIESQHSVPEITTRFPEALQRVTSSTWHQALKHSIQAEEKLLLLQTAVQQLLHTPTEEKLTEVRQHWHHTHNVILQLQPFFTLGNINPGLFKQLQQAQQQLDAWPIEPGYLDYFDVYTHSGIVNDIALPINAHAIRQQHGFSSDADVALGMHAIAYLLWGEDQQRPASDFQSRPVNSSERKNGLEASDLPAQRRSALLSLQVSLLHDDLKSLSYRLDHDASGINVSYFSLPPQSQLQLWQGVLDDMLKRQIQTELIAPLKQRTQPQVRENNQDGVPARSSTQTHQQYTGRPLSTVSALVRAIETLVITDSDKVTHEGLDHWLNPELDRQQLRQRFSDIYASVTSLEEQSEPTPEQAERLEQQVQALTLALIPASPL